jgi:hypothetical protein
MIVGDAPMFGVYTFGNYAKNYPMVLDLTYPISERDSGNFVTEDIEIGSVMAVGGDVFVSWYNHTTGGYGVDKIDYENKLDGAYFESMIRSIFRGENANYTKFFVAYVSKPDLTDIEINYSKDFGQNFLPTTEKDDIDRKIVYSEEGAEATVLQMKVIFTTSENDAPSIESAGLSTS